MTYKKNLAHNSRDFFLEGQRRNVVPVGKTYFITFTVVPLAKRTR